MSADRIVVEVLDTHGRVRLRERVALGPERRSFTLGRSTEADVMLDDPHVAALHVSIEVTPEGALRASDLGSINGFLIGAQRHRGARDLAIPDGELQIGRTTLRIRTGLETLAPEKPDHGITADLSGTVPWVAIWTAIIWVGLVVYSVWLEAPRDLPVVVTTSLTYALAVGAAWVAVWSLLSRVLKGEWRWTIHAAIFFGFSAATFVLDGVLDVVWFAFALPQLSFREPALWGVGLGLLLYWHLTNVSPARRRTLKIVAAALPIFVVGSATWIQSRNQARDVNHIDVRERLFPPALRIRTGTGTDEYFTAAAKLKRLADEARKALPASETESGGDE